MNISKLALIASLGGALMAFGCSENGTGTGGTGGGGGVGGGPDPLCQSSLARCGNSTIWTHFPCCDQPVPDQANACDGTESIENPANCTATGTTVTHQLTIMEVAGDCNVGYNLDSCDGTSCLTGGLAPPDGLVGVDNAIAALGPTLAGVGGNLDGVNQLLADTLCGMSNDDEKGTCWGGPDDGSDCVEDAGCTPVADAKVCEFDSSITCSSAGDCLETAGGGDCINSGTCNTDDYDCEVMFAAADIRFVVDANESEDCANVTVVSGTESNDVILNLSDEGCASGFLGNIPVNLGGIDGTFANATVRMTVSADGFSDGLLGLTIDEATASAIADALIDGGSDVVAQVLDINNSTPPTQDTSAACNALSGTLAIGGIAEEGTGGNGGNGGNGGSGQ